MAQGQLTAEFSKVSSRQFLLDIGTANNLTYITYSQVINNTNNTPSYTENDVMGHVIFGKRVKSSDVSIVVANYSWSNNTVFQQWDPGLAGIYNTKFYCINSQQNVYKCIYNNNSANSTSEPLLTITDGTFETSDGYLWKYLYSISNTAYTAFATANYIPVFTNINVAQNSVPGTIDAFNKISGGSGYIEFNQDYISYIANGTSIQLGNTASTVDGIYNNASIIIYTQQGITEQYNIKNYNGTSKIATFDRQLSFYDIMYLKSSNTGTYNSNESITQPVQTLNINNTYFANNVVVNINEVLATYNNSNLVVLGVSPSTNGISVDVFNTGVGVTANSYIIPYNEFNSGIAQTGTVTLNTTSHILTGTGTNFSANLINQYIILKASNSTAIGVVNSVTNTTSLTLKPDVQVSGVANTFTNANYWFTSFGGEVISVSNNEYSGTISSVQNNTAVIFINTISSLISVGETITTTTNSFSGVVQYANSTALICDLYTGVLNKRDTIRSVLTGTTATVLDFNQYDIVSINSNNSTEAVASYPVFINNSVERILEFITTSPAKGDPYVISPVVTITGDGSNALAYALVDSNNSISGLVSINAGQNYTEANVVITSSYGSNASFTPLISPRAGHGNDPVEELGSKNIMVTQSFGNTEIENFELPYYGDYHTIDLLFDATLNQTIVELDNFTTANVAVTNVVGNFIKNEVVLDTSNNAIYGFFNTSNSSTVQLVNCTTNLLTNTVVKGARSGATANVLSSTLQTFNLVPNTTQICTQPTTGITGKLINSVSNTITVTNCDGVFVTNSVITDSITNSSATVVNVYKSYANSPASFDNLNQTVRYTTTNTIGSFVEYETVSVPNTNATGTIISTNTDIDLYVSNVTGTFINNEIINTSGNAFSGVVKFANSSYVKVTNYKGALTNNVVIAGVTSGVTATVSNSYNVLIVGSLHGDWNLVGNTSINGSTSGAIGYNMISNTVTIPDMVINQGKILYTYPIQPTATLNANSQSVVQLVLGF